MLNLTQRILSLVILPAIYLTAIDARSPAGSVAETRNPTGKIGEPMAASQDLTNEENACREYSNGFVLAKTKRFYIEICGDRTKPLSYYISGQQLGNSKRALKVLDMQSYTFDRRAPSDLERFVATDGNIKYILTWTSMAIEQNDRVVSVEPTIYYKRLK